MRIFRWLFKVIFGDFEQLLYVLVSLGVFLFLVLTWKTHKEIILSSYLTAVVFAILCFLAVVLVFRLVVEVAKSVFREDMELFEVIAFVEAKRKAEELKKQNRSPEIKVAGFGGLRSFLSSIFSFLASKEKVAEEKSREEQKEEVPVSSTTNVQSTVQHQAVGEVEEKAEEEITEDSKREQNAPVIKVAVPKEVESAADRIRETFRKITGNNYTSVEPSVEKILGVYLEEPETSSLGALSVNSNGIAEKLMKVPLLVHVANVVEEAARLSSSLEFPTEKLGLLFAALTHDIGKLPSVWKKYDSLYVSHKHPDYGANFIASMAESLSLPYDSSWWENVVKAVRFHHSSSKEVSYLSYLREADFRARREESNADEAELKEFYKEVVGDLMSGGLEEVISRFVKNFEEKLLKRLQDDPSYFYFIYQKRLFLFPAETSEGKLRFYLDPEYIVKTCIDGDVALLEALKGYRDRNGYLTQNIKRNLYEGLVKAGYIASTKMHKVSFDKGIKRIVKKGFVKGEDAIMAFLLVPEKLGVDVEQVVEAVSQRVVRKPSEYYIGKGYDEISNQELFIPNKELVDRYC
jgi:HD-GYP domain-containing protein (c-di-GMP phosphodiesterase class II)